mgnify:CR=1 FL=1
MPRSILIGVDGSEYADIATELGIKDGETTEDGLFSLETVACLGCCSLAPVLSINGKVYGKLDRKSTIKILKEYRAK